MESELLDGARADRLPLEIISHILEFLPSVEDRKAAAMTCKQWYQACQAPNLRKKEKVIITSNDVFEELYNLDNSHRIFSNVCARGVVISRRTGKFWRKYAPYIRSLSINSCEIREINFVKIISKCPELEKLEVSHCRELFLSGLLLESEAARNRLRPTMANVRSVSLGYNRYLSDSHLYKLTSVFCNLEELLLPGCYISFDAAIHNRFYQNGHADPSKNVLTFGYIHDYIKNNAAKLKSLSFADTLIDGPATRNLAVTENLALDKLSLYRCLYVTSEAVRILSEHQIYLTHLDIGVCPRIEDNALLNICARLTGLKYLSVHGCRGITDRGVADLWKLTAITSLNISECEKLTDAGILAALGMHENRVLEELRMSHLPNLTDLSICVIMPNVPNLRVLDVGCCYKALTDRAVQSVFLNVRHLRTLILTMCHKVMDRGLTGIAFELPPNSNQPQARLKMALKNIQDFDMPGDSPAMIEYKKIVSEINPNSDLRGGCIRQLKYLSSLTLSGCSRITDLSLRFGLKLPHLRVLDLSNCQLITADGLLYLTQSAKSLEILNLDNCNNVNDLGVGHVLKKFSRLKSLTLGSRKITNRILDYFGRRIVNLKYLDVKHCQQLSVNTINRIIADNPQLQIIYFPTNRNGNQNGAPPPPPSRLPLR